MIIGYSAWGFVGDGVVDSPDGGRLTRALFIEHLIKSGHEIIWLQKNRDIDDNGELFGPGRLYDTTPSKDFWDADQKSALCRLKYDSGFPDLDVLFLEWRWEIPGRNVIVAKGDSNYMPDYDRQWELLRKYIRTSTRIIIWDKDEKLTITDEQWLRVNQFWPCQIDIMSPALFPPKLIFDRHTLLFPCDLQMIRDTKVNISYKYLIGYVGSQYERDEQVYKYINPFSFAYAGKVVFAGNWLKYTDTAYRNLANFPAIHFLPRVLPRDMANVYSDCLSCVLLCKPNYAKHCHITQRIHEVASCGVIAIGLKEQRGIERFVHTSLIVSDAYELREVIIKLQNMNVRARQDILDQNIELLEPFDIKHVMSEFNRILKSQA